MKSRQVKVQEELEVLKENIEDLKRKLAFAKEQVMLMLRCEPKCSLSLRPQNSIGSELMNLYFVYRFNCIVNNNSRT